MKHVILALALLTVVSASRASFAEIDGKSWNEARKIAVRAMRTPGDGQQKSSAIGVLARDDSLRAAELFVKWTAASQAMRQRDLGPALAEARERLVRVEEQLRKGYVEPYTDANDNGRWDDGEPFKDRNRNGKRDGWPPHTMNADHRKSWKTLQQARDVALNHVQVEDMVLDQIGAAIERFTDTTALHYLSTDGIEALDRAKAPGPVRLGIVGGLINLEATWRVERLIALGGRDGDPKARIRIINWAGTKKAGAAWDLVVDALGDKHMAVRRMAVAALKDYDDPRAVKPLIDALGKAEGLLAQEIDQVLYWYTGHAFQGDVKIWRKWFKHEGEAWIAKGDKTRHAPREVTHAGTTTASTYTTFYDIPTESKRIVFVLDRSGSMESKARHVPKGKSRPKPRPKPRGPITGDKRKSDKGKGKGKGKDEDDEEDGPIEGSTKLEIAKNKLAQTVERIHKDVHFGLVFYSTDVSVWQKPPSLLQASKRNKKDAIRWFSALEPSGSTSLFPALMRALEYADAFGAPGGKQRKKGSSGANTIFLLSDGSPTAPGGDKALPASEVAAQLRAFLEANEIYRCVVHTIGVGPSHNRSLMKRIASATGGEYRAVGVD